MGWPSPFNSASLPAPHGSCSPFGPPVESRASRLGRTTLRSRPRLLLRAGTVALRFSGPRKALDAGPAYDGSMRRPLRLALGIVGLAAAVHGVASLTGGWLGTPPWWEHEVEKFVSPPV